LTSSRAHASPWSRQSECTSPLSWPATMSSITRVPNPRRMCGVTVGPPHSIQRKLTRPSAVRDHVISTRPSVANRDQYCSVGGEFMQGNCNRLSRIRLQHYRWSINSHTPLSLAAVRRKLLRDQTVKLSSRPARLHEQPMDLCEGIDAPLRSSDVSARERGRATSPARTRGQIAMWLRIS
jgi:hypothetical protein